MENLQVTEPKAKCSFSFSCSNDEGRKSESDDDSYIEIELEPVLARLGRDGDKVAEEELELRISFSSAVALPDVCTDESFEKAPRSPLFSSSLSEWSFSSRETTNSWSGPLAVKPCCQNPRTIERRVQFPAVSRFADTFLSSSRTFSETGDKPGRQIDASKEMQVESNHWEFVQSRKGCNNSSITKRRQGGVMMKIWMKLRSKNLCALLESLLKPAQLNWAADSNRKNRVAEGFDKCLVQNRRKGGNWKMFGSGNNSGVFEPGVGRGGGGKRRANSCPVSSKASPLHPGEANIFGGECSIQAAIAHCKRSYGQPCDFRV